LSQTKNETNHIFCITWLITSFEEARQFFCGAEIEYKDKLVLLIKEEGLLALEMLNPYVLKLSMCVEKINMYIFQTFQVEI